MAIDWHWDTPTSRTKDGHEVVVDYDSVGHTEAVSPVSEFERFAEFAEKLVQVPKAEIDEKRKRS